MIKLLEEINADHFTTSYFQLEPLIVWTDFGQKKQTGLQYRENEDPWTSAVGRSKGNELEVNILNPAFAGTVFEEIINKYNLKKTRLMWLDKYSCYSMHTDETPRLHIPLITDPQCFFVFRTGVIKHLSKDAIYWVDTRKMHTFINCSESPRLHLVGAVES